MFQPVQVRCARPDDASVIAEFNCGLAWETERKPLDPATVLAGVRALLDDRAKGVYYVAELGGQLVGQLCITYEWSDWRNGNFWWLQSVFVHQDWRGQGVFRALLDHVLSEARLRSDVIGLRLYVEQGNAVAQEVYQRRGMARTGYQVFEVAWPAGRSL